MESKVVTDRKDAVKKALQDVTVAEQKVQEDLLSNKNVSSHTTVAQASKSEELSKHLEEVVQKAMAAVKES
jgi:hypothetical protein